MNLLEFKKSVGKEVGISDWFLIDQDKINKFADLTHDHQFIHVDIKKSKDTPFKTTIAHGFLTLSLLPSMASQVISKSSDTKMSVNYGLNKLRFINPVLSNSKIRGRFFLKKIEQKEFNELTLFWEITIEIKDTEKPAMIAEWINRRYFNN